MGIVQNEAELVALSIKTTDLVNAQHLGIRSEANDCGDDDGCDGDCGCDE